MRRLTLTRETLTELASEDLRLVQGAVATRYCATDLGLCDAVTKIPTTRCTPPPAP